ncbi:MAG: hypothetical protein K0B14_18380 [Anaerolineaceae bacterium]|nr:hypothetical protein [Anaerolineaceae bacterium]
MFEDEFLDDQDLFYEMLLSKEDAWKLYHRGEITREQLNRYLDKLLSGKVNLDTKKAKNKVVHHP